MSVKTFCLIFMIALSSASCLNYCEVDEPQIKVFTTQKEIQQIPLSKHIRGYDLDFSSSDEKVIHVFEPYHVADIADVTIKAGYSMINVDGRNSDTHLWARQGIMFAHGGSQSIAVGYGEFSSGVLPKIEGFNYFNLPYASNCYNGLIFNNNLDIVIDCEKIASKQDQMSDLTCIITRVGQLKCKDFGSITKTYKRRSVIYNTGGAKYLMSASLTNYVSTGFQNQTFVNIYRVSETGVQFNMIVDRRTLGLDFLSINDIDVIEIQGHDYVVLTDIHSKLVIFRYTQINTVEDITVVNVQGTPLQFTTSPTGTWLIANQKQVMQCTYAQASQSLTVVRRYELDPTDSQVIDLQASYRFLVVRTALNRLYTYDAQFTQLKYLLNREDINQYTSVVVSPFYPRIFHINTTKMASVAITSGYLYISQVQASTDVLIIANSGSASCVLNVRIEFVKDETKIYQKKTMTNAYRLQSNVPVKFDLSQYFGGSNLRYKASTTKQLAYDIQHVNSYVQQDTQNDQIILFSKIIDIDSKNYWLAKFSDVAVRFYKCTLKNIAEISCVENVADKIDAKGLVFAHADGIIKQNGKAVMSWTYADSNRIDIKQLQSKGCMSIYVGYQSRYSQVLTATKYNIYVQKQLSRLSIYQPSAIKIQIFSKNDFTAAQLKALGGGFYPRQIMDSHQNPHIFFLKFPISIVTISYTGGRQLQIISVTKVSSTYIPDDLWDIVIGKQTLLLFTTEQVAEYAILADGNIQKLHTISLDKKPIFPVRYELQTDTAYFECEDNTIQYIRLNQPALDSKYYTLPIRKPSANGASDWDVSGSWLLVNSGQAYYQYKEPTLQVTSLANDTVYKQSGSLTLTVLSDNQEKAVVANVTSFNYPIKIEVSGAEDNGLTLPEQGQNNVIPFPITKYFNGSVANYKIVCPYCLDQTIILVPPINKLNENKELSNFLDVVPLHDNSGAIALLQNSLKMLDLKNAVVVSTTIDTTGECSSMGINQEYLAVFCSSHGNQELFLYEVATASIKAITMKGKYLIPAEAGIHKPSEIGVYKMLDKATVFIHDVDLMNPLAKESNIKIFELSDAISFKGIIDSSRFKLATFQPINSMSIHGNSMLITIGGKGIGYINLLNYAKSADFISLQQQPSFLDYTLDDTLYLRVQIYKQNATLISALVTTSNSFSYVLSFRESNGHMIFNKIEEIYNRYGHQLSLNWGLIDDRFVMLSFYNTTTSVQSLTLYKRSSSGIVDFFTSEQLTIPKAALRPPKAALVHTSTVSQKNSFLYKDNSEKPSSSASLVLYNVTDEYGLLLKYDKASSFNTIKVYASNDFYTVSKDLTVSFDGSVGGVKWYAVVIVVVLVAIAVGVAFGFYLKMKKKKADSKKVSLFTENQEVDEEV